MLNLQRIKALKQTYKTLNKDALIISIVVNLCLFVTDNYC